MIKFAVPSVFFLAVMSASLTAKTFEGDLTMQIDSGRDATNISITAKGDRMALKLPQMQGGFALMNWEDSSAKIIMPQQRMYIEAPMSQLAPNIPQTMPTGQVEVTDETKEILGYPTRKVIYTDGSDQSILWMTGDLGSFQMLGGMTPDQMPAEIKKAFPDGAMPLEIQSNNNGEISTITVTKISARDVPNAELEVPAGFQAMQLPGGMSFPGMQ